jgi:hypothetical protein
MDMRGVAEGGLEFLESIPHAKRGRGDENGTGGGIADCGLRIADCGLRRGVGRGRGSLRGGHRARIGKCPIGKGGEGVGFRILEGGGASRGAMTGTLGSDHWSGVEKWGNGCWVGDDGF